MLVSDNLHDTCALARNSHLELIISYAADTLRILWCLIGPCLRKFIIGDTGLSQSCRDIKTWSEVDSDDIFLVG